MDVCEQRRSQRTALPALKLTLTEGEFRQAPWRKVANHSPSKPSDGKDGGEETCGKRHDANAGQEPGPPSLHIVSNAGQPPLHQYTPERRIASANIVAIVYFFPVQISFAGLYRTYYARLIDIARRSHAPRATDTSAASIHT
jgi:hypothetical protein